MTTVGGGCHSGPVSEFHGIPVDALDFYEDLEAENSRTWWKANEQRYATSVREPMQALADLLEPEFGPAKLYRPHRDVRFSKDKSPYKDHQGALAASTPGLGFYVQVGADGLLTGGGFYPTGADQLPRFRAAVDDPASGQALQEVVDGLLAAGFDLRGDRVATRPRGVPGDHPRVEILRHKTFFAGRQHGAPDWLTTPAAADHVRDDWRALRPLVDWLTEHVGATTAPRTR